MAKFRSGTDYCWGITLERGPDNRWRLFSARNQHNHELASAMEDVLGGQKLLRDGIPQEFEVIGKMLAAAGVEPSKINLVLQINVQKQSMPITYGRTRMCSTCSAANQRYEHSAGIRGHRGKAGSGPQLAWNRPKLMRRNGACRLFLRVPGCTARIPRHGRTTDGVNRQHPQVQLRDAAVHNQCIGWSVNT